MLGGGEVRIELEGALELREGVRGAAGLGEGEAEIIGGDGACGIELRGLLKLGEGRRASSIGP